MREKNRHGGENRSGEIRWDFSVNINPLGMPEAAKAALLSGWNVFENYPDDGCEALRQALAGRFGVDGGQVVCGNGASDLIYRLCACGGFRRVLLPVPSFSEYQRALAQRNALLKAIRKRTAVLCRMRGYWKRSLGILTLCFCAIRAIRREGSSAGN